MQPEELFLVTESCGIFAQESDSGNGHMSTKIPETFRIQMV